MQFHMTEVARIPFVVNGRVLRDQCNGHRTVQGTDRFVARKIWLLSNNVNLDTIMMRGLLIRRALGVGESNLERLVMWKLRSPGRCGSCSAGFHTGSW
jgi:hypothetical protein